MRRLRSLEDIKIAHELGQVLPRDLHEGDENSGIDHRVFVVHLNCILALAEEGFKLNLPKYALGFWLGTETPEPSSHFLIMERNNPEQNTSIEVVIAHPLTSIESHITIKLYTNKQCVLKLGGPYGHITKFMLEKWDKLYADLTK